MQKGWQQGSVGAVKSRDAAKAVEPSLIPVLAPPVALALPQRSVMKGLVLGQDLCVFVDGRSDAIP